MNHQKFLDYIDFLRESVGNLVEYRAQTGTLDSDLIKVRDDLFDEDPFIVFSASMIATVMLADKSIYH